MQTLNLNSILNRTTIARDIQSLLTQFEKNKHDISFKRGIYIYGSPGSGKTEFVLQLLKEMNYDTIKYDAGDIRNKSIIDTINKNNMSDKSVLSLLKKKNQTHRHRDG